METIRLIKTMNGDYINVNHIIQFGIENIIKNNNFTADWVVVIHTISADSYQEDVFVTCPIGDKDMAAEICCEIANFMQSQDKDNTLFCVQTYISQTWQEESHLKLVTNKEEDENDN